MPYSDLIVHKNNNKINDNRNIPFSYPVQAGETDSQSEAEDGLRILPGKRAMNSLQNRRLWPPDSSR